MRKPLVTLLIFISIFISTITFFKTPFEGYLHYVIFLMLLPFFMSRYGIPKIPLKILFLPFLIGYVMVLIGNNTNALFFKIAIGMLLSSSFYYYVIQYYEGDVEEMFRIYLKWAYYAAIIGIIQVISYRLGFRPGYDYSWIFNKWGLVPNASGGIRMNSIFSEPSQFGIVIAPAAFIAVYNFLLKRRYVYSTFQNLVILLAIIFTTSSVAFLGIMLSFIILTISFGKFNNLLIGTFIVLVAGFTLYKYSPEFQLRVDTSLGLWVEKDFRIENVNTSSFVLYNNFHIASQNLLDSYLIGTGLGSHPIAYEKYSLTNAVGFIDFEFNQSDANSMFLRLMSETGILGMVFFIVIIFKCFVRKSILYEDNPYWLISGAVLVLILLYMIRQGNYFLNGFPFFVWLYYYTYVRYREFVQEKKATQQAQGTELNTQGNVLT